MNPRTDTIYADSGGSVAVISGRTNKVTTATIPVGFDSFSVAVNPQTNTIYVSNWNDGTVAVISGSTDTVIATADAGITPRDVAVNPQTNTIYVAGDIYDTLSVLTW